MLLNRERETIVIFSENLVSTFFPLKFQVRIFERVGERSKMSSPEDTTNSSKEMEEDYDDDELLMPPIFRTESEMLKYALKLVGERYGVYNDRYNNRYKDNRTI